MKKSYGTLSRSKGDIIAETIESKINRFFKEKSIMHNIMYNGFSPKEANNIILQIFEDIFRLQKGKLIDVYLDKYNKVYIKYYSPTLNEVLELEVLYTNYGWKIFNINYIKQGLVH